MSDEGRKGKTAVVFVHGQGEHVPLGSAPELARTTWAADPDAPADGPGGSRLKLTPDASIGEEETPRATAPGKSGAEFFEFYWSDLMTGNQFAHVWRWFRNLIRKPADQTPRRLLPVRQLFIRVAEVGAVFIAAFALFTVSVGVILSDPARRSPQQFFEAQCWSTGGDGPAGWPAGIELYDNELFFNQAGLRSASVQSALGIDPATAQNVNSLRSICEFGDLGLGLAFDSSRGGPDLLREEIGYLPPNERTLRLGCQALDSTATQSARRVAACVEWRSRLAQNIETEGHTDGVLSVAISADGRRAVTSSYDNTARVWDAQTGDEIETLLHASWVSNVVFSPDGALIATVSGDGAAHVWDANSGVELVTLYQDFFINDVAFSPDGARIATGGSDGTGKVWDAVTGAELATLSGHQDSISSIVFSEDGRRLLTASNDFTARIWDARTGQQFQPALRHNDWVTDAVFSRDGSRVATSSWDMRARVWDAQTGAPVTRELPHDDVIGRIAFSPDGRRLATASNDMTARIWDAVSGAELAALTSHYGVVTGVAFSPDGGRLLTWSEDSTARIWDASGKSTFELGLIQHQGSVTSAAFSRDGERIVTGSWDRSGRVSDASGFELVGLGASTTADADYRYATDLANTHLNALRDELGRYQNGAALDGQSATALRYFTTWLRARLDTGAEFGVILAAPILIGGVILFIVFSDWIGLARRKAAEAPGVMQRRYLRSPTWLYIAILMIAPPALALAYLAISEQANAISAGQGGFGLATAYIVSTALIGGVGVLALALIGRHLVDASALRSIGALPEPRRSWRTKLRPWAILLWIPAWAALGIGTMVVSGFSETAFLVVTGAPIIANAIVFGSRLRRLRREPDLGRWPFPWNLVNLMLFATMAFVSTGLTSFYGGFFAPAVAVAAVVTTLASAIGLLVFLTDSRGGAIRHLLFAVVSAVIAMSMLTAGFLAADALPALRPYVTESGRLIALALSGVVALALTMHLVRTALTKAQSVKALRVFVIPSLITLALIGGLSWLVTYFSNQIDEERAVANAGEEIRAALILGQTASASGDVWRAPLSAELGRSPELERLAVWTYYDIFSERSRAGLPTPTLPSSPELASPAEISVHGAENAWSASDVAFTADGARVATLSGDGSVELWDAAQGRRLLLLNEPVEIVYDDAGNPLNSYSAVGRIALSSDGAVLAGAAYDGKVFLWDVSTASENLGALLATLEVDDFALPIMAFDPTAPALATGSQTGIVTIWDTASYSSTPWSPLASMDVHDTPITILEYSSDGSRLVSGDLYGRAIVWDADLYTGEFEAFNTELGRQITLINAHQDSVVDLALDRSGDRLVTTSYDYQAYVWDVEEGSPRLGELIVALDTTTRSVNAMAFSPDGTWLATANSDGSATLWTLDAAPDVPGAEVEERAILAGHGQSVFALAWSGDGGSLATASYDNTVRVWRTDENSSDFAQSIAALEGHDAGLAMASFNPAPGSMQVATATWDGKLKLWTLDCAASIDELTYARFARCFGSEILRPGVATPVATPDLYSTLDPYATIYESPAYEIPAYDAAPADLAADPFAYLADPTVDAFAAAAPATTGAFDVQPDYEASLYPAATVPVTPSSIPAAAAASGDPMLTDFLVRLRNELSTVAAVNAIETGLVAAALVTLLLIWARMLLVSLTIAIASAPFALFLGFGNISQLDQFGQTSLLRGLQGLEFLEQSPLRLVNAVYAFFLAFCIAWFVTQVLREILNFRAIRGLSLIALGLAGAFAAAAYYMYAPAGSPGSIASVQLIWMLSVIIVIIVVTSGLFAAAHYFLVPIMADSARYLSPKPHNIARRREIVDRGVRLLNALTRSGRYDRIVVVAHSLGTLVAFDTVSRFWTQFEDSALGSHLRGSRAAMLNASTALSEGVRDALTGSAEDVAQARPQRSLRRGLQGAAKPIEARTDEKRLDRLCELLNELADGYGKAARPRKARKKADPEAAERKAKGAAARAEAAEAIRSAIRCVRAGPASFVGAAANLRSAASSIRNAYGIDPDAPGRFSLASKRTLGEAEAVAAALESSAQKLSLVDGLLERYLGCQKRFAAELASRERDERWLVTDFVTLGSPLTHGEYLLGADHRVRTYQEGAETIAKPMDALKGRLAIEQQANIAQAEGAPIQIDENLEAAFPASRWTNLFFRGEGVLGGDIVGGPVWTVFGPGVIDLALDGKPNGSPFAHNEYWKSSMNDDSMCRGDAPDHIRALRKALRLAPA